MSNKIKYQFSAIPIEWLTSKKLSSSEKILLGVLIWLSDENGESKTGYDSLAEFSCLSRRQCINLVDRLEKMGYIERIIRNNRRYSSILRVCFGGLGGAIQNGRECTRVHSQSENRECNLKQSGVQFKAIGSATDSTLNKDLNLNLKLINNGSAIECTPDKKNPIHHIAPADVAAGRSMPNQESARKVQVETQAANDDKSLVEGIKANFKDVAADLEFFKVGNQYGLRKKSKYSLIEAVRASEVVDYLASLGIVAQVVDYNQHYPNEEVI